MSDRVRILFVCTGNICRSPTAHGVMRALVAERGLQGLFEVDSAGFEDWHVGEPADPRSRSLARRRGIDIDDLRARQLSDADFRTFDVVIGLDQPHVDRARARCEPEFRDRIRAMGAYCDVPPGRGVPDPYDGTEEDFEKVFELIDRGCRRLLAELAEGRSAHCSKVEQP